MTTNCRSLPGFIAATHCAARWNRALAVRRHDKTVLGVSVAPSKDAKGLVVEDVDPNGRAANAGIQKGDVISSVNGKTTSIEELRAALKSVGDRPALLLIHRGAISLFVTVKPANG
jgi:S1-C subfamily serine protease